jgi:thiol:disulfide interchange protein DsbC
MKKIVERRADIAFFLKLFAIVSPDPQTTKSVICTRSMAMLEDAFEKKDVPKEECQSKEFENNMKFAEESGISSAPTLVFADGTIQSGYSEAAALEKRIDSTKTKPAEQTEKPKQEDPKKAAEGTAVKAKTKAGAATQTQSGK